MLGPKWAHLETIGDDNVDDWYMDGLDSFMGFRFL